MTIPRRLIDRLRDDPWGDREPMSPGEVWTESGWGVWVVESVVEGEAVVSDVCGGTEAVPLGADGLPVDRERGWSRVLP